MKLALGMFIVATLCLGLVVVNKLSVQSCSYDPYKEGSKCNALCEDIYHKSMESYDAYNRKCLCNTER